jgi:hypothetical protein
MVAVKDEFLSEGAWCLAVVAGVVMMPRVGGADRWIMKKPSLGGARTALAPLVPPARASLLAP